jgi:Zn-dependent metalloprotease
MRKLVTLFSAAVVAVSTTAAMGVQQVNAADSSGRTCNGSTVSGIGRAAAAKIWFRALTVYMTSSTSYKGARTATLNAAGDLYGAGSTQHNTVAAAWSAVAVP